MDIVRIYNMRTWLANDIYNFDRFSSDAVMEDSEEGKMLGSSTVDTTSSTDATISTNDNTPGL